MLPACGVGQRPVLSDESSQGVSSRGAGDGAGVNSNAGLDGAVSAEVNPAGKGNQSPPLSRSELGSAPPALITSTGVLVPVINRTPTGYKVLSPCGNQTDLVYGQAVWGADVVLDPGHGGDEKGALGPNGATEAELNLDIARRTASLLEGQGVSVALTRTGDYRIPVRNRAAIADQLAAKAFVSVHHNSPTADASDKPGTEIYVQSGSSQSNRLGGLIYQELTEALAVFDVTWSRRPDAGVLTVLNDAGDNAYGIDRYPTTTTALAELAYISNPAEAVVLSTSEYRQTAAQALSDGIIRYLNTKDPGSGFVSKPRLFNPSGETGGTEGCVDPPLG